MLDFWQIRWSTRLCSALATRTRMHLSKSTRLSTARGYKWHDSKTGIIEGIFTCGGGRWKISASMCWVPKPYWRVVPSEIFATSTQRLVLVGRPKYPFLFNWVVAITQILFHLCSAQHCQVYGGITKEKPRQRAAGRRLASHFKGGNLVNATSTINLWWPVPKYVITMSGAMFPTQLSKQNRTSSSPRSSSTMASMLEIFIAGWNIHPNGLQQQFAANARLNSSPIQALRFLRTFRHHTTQSPHIGRLMDVKIAGRGLEAELKA